MYGSGKIVDSTDSIIVGAIIAESDNLGNFKTPIIKTFESDINGIFKGDFKNNTFYTASYTGTKKYTFNTANGIPAVIKMIDDNWLPEIIVKPKKNYWWVILLVIGTYIITKKK